VTTYVLGGMDTEMGEIEQLLKVFGHTVVHAVGAGGDRVIRRKALECSGPRPVPGQVWVECCHKDYSKEELLSIGVSIVDHHEVGDPGYAKPPAEYWEASSLGQVCAQIGVSPSKRQRFIAAADHCLLSAYQGECPHISQEEFTEFRMDFFYHSDPMTEIIRVRNRIIASPIVNIGNAKVSDVSKIFNSRDAKWLSDAGCMFGLKTMTIVPKKYGVRLFVSNLESEEIQYFLDHYVEDMGKVLNKYGDEQRRFAGAMIGGKFDR
jgi:hypothetical protein